MLENCNLLGVCDDVLVAGVVCGVECACGLCVDMGMS